MSDLNRNVLFNNVIHILKKNPYGLSSTDLSKMLKINRMTLVKYLGIMREKGLVEFKEIGMAKVWHTATKYDMVNMISKYESAYINELINGRQTNIRKTLGDSVPLSVFRVMKVAMGLSNDPRKAMYSAGQFMARTCFPEPDSMATQDIVNSLSKIFANLRIGLLSPIQINPAEWSFKLEESSSAHETLVRGNNLCHFEAGLISGFVSHNLKREVIVRETKCIGTGAAFCEFTLQFIKVRKRKK